MSAKPFYSLITRIILPPLIIFFMNIALYYFLGPRIIDENRIDKVFHVLGGVVISFSIAGIWWHLFHREIFVLQDIIIFRLLVFGFLCFVIIGWEILEYIIGFAPKYLTYSDTITDMICGLIGGLSAMLFIRKPIC